MLPQPEAASADSEQHTCTSVQGEALDIYPDRASEASDLLQKRERGRWGVFSGSRTLFGMPAEQEPACQWCADLGSRGLQDQATFTALKRRW